MVTKTDEKTDVQGQDSKAKSADKEQESKSQNIDELSLEELRTLAQSQTKEIEGLKAENGRKEGEIVRLQNTMRGIQKRDNKVDFAPLLKRMEGLEDMLDTISDRFEEQYGEGEGKTRKTHAQLRAEQRNAEKEKGTQSQDNNAEVQAYVAAVRGMGLDLKDPLVIEAIGGEDNPRTAEEAIAYLAEKVKERDTAKMKTDLEAESQIALEAAKKDAGLLDQGAGQPGATTKDAETMSPDEKLREGFKTYRKENK